MILDITDSIVNFIENVDNIIIYMLSSKKIYNCIINNNNLWNLICLKYFKLSGNFNNFKIYINNNIKLKYNNIIYNIQKNVRFKIGKSKQNHICILKDRTISKLHAEFKVINPSKIFIRDLDSISNTYVNNIIIPKLTKIQVYVGDEINIGNKTTLKIILV